MRVSQLEEILHADLQGEDYETVAGLIFTTLGRVPNVGDHHHEERLPLRSRPRRPAADLSCESFKRSGLADGEGEEKSYELTRENKLQSKMKTATDDTAQTRRDTEAPLRRRCPGRPSERRQVDAAQPHPRPQGLDRLDQAADDAQPHRRESSTSRAARSRSSTRPAFIKPAAQAERPDDGSRALDVQRSGRPGGSHRCHGGIRKGRRVRRQDGPRAEGKASEREARRGPQQDRLGEEAQAAADDGALRIARTLRRHRSDLRGERRRRRGARHSLLRERRARRGCLSERGLHHAAGALSRRRDRAREGSASHVRRAAVHDRGGGRSLRKKTNRRA